MKNAVIGCTLVFGWVLVILMVSSLLANNASGCFWYGLGLFTSSVALTLEMDAWL